MEESTDGRTSKLILFIHCYDIHGLCIGDTAKQ